MLELFEFQCIYFMFLPGTKFLMSVRWLFSKSGLFPDASLKNTVTKEFKRVVIWMGLMNKIFL